MEGDDDDNDCDDDDGADDDDDAFLPSMQNRIMKSCGDDDRGKKRMIRVLMECTSNGKQKLS